MHRVVVVTGPVASGKTSLAMSLGASVGARRVSTRFLLGELMTEAMSRDRTTFQEFGELLDRETGGKWLVEAIAALLDSSSSAESFVIDSPRLLSQIQALRALLPGGVAHIHLTAQDPVLIGRYESRDSDLEEPTDYAEVRRNPTEAAVETLALHADLVLDTTYLDLDAVRARVEAELARLRQPAEPPHLG